MSGESKQIDEDENGPENGGMKSGPCLIAGFQPLTVVHLATTTPSSGRRMRGTATTLHRRGRIAGGLDDVL